MGAYNSVLRANGGIFDITGNQEAGFDVGRNATLSLRNRGAGLDVDISGNGVGIGAWQTATLRTGDGGSCQGRCRFFHAAIAMFFSSPCFDLFGFRCTVFSGVQFLVDPDQRSGFSFLAFS
jgi:hypothetical protein